MPPKQPHSNPDWTPTTRTGASLQNSIFVIAIGTALLAYNFYANRYFFHDDAFISLRYALNFVEFGDLSWNPGDRVEGYTNFLHLIFVAELMSASIDPVLATRIVNLAGAICLGVSIAAGAAQLAPGIANLPVRMLALAGFLSSISVPVWILGGLETVLVAGFLAAAVSVLLPCFRTKNPETMGKCALGGCLFALAYLTRPDAVIMNAMAGLGVLCLGRAPLGRRLVQCIVIGAIPAAVLALHMVWRINYYGDILPNTFYAKVGIDFATRLSSVFVYFAKAGLYFLPVVPLGFLGLCIVIFRKGPLSTLGRQSLFLAGCITGHCGYVIWSGGDHMPAARVLVGTLGPGCMLLAAGGSAIPEKMRLPATILVLASFMIGPLMVSPYKMNPAAYVGLIVGDHIDQAWPKDALVALNTAGSTPFSAPDRRYIDMLGLNDRVIAKRQDVPIRASHQSLVGHSKGDGAFVLTKDPDYIIIGPAEGRDRNDPWFLSDLEIVESPEFDRCYEKRIESLPYSIPEAASLSYVDNPLTFTYFQRICEES